MRNLTFGTKFIITFIVFAFFDEVLTLEVGSVFFTPVKLFSLFATVLYFLQLKNNVRKDAYSSQSRLGFTFLYLYILLSIMFAIVGGDGSIGSLAERFFHFSSALIIIDLCIGYFVNGRTQLDKIITCLIVIFYIEVAAASIEVIRGQPLINFGIVGKSPLKIRGFHADRIYLAEYLALGWFLMYISKSSYIKLIFFGVISFVLALASGSNTAIILFAMVGIYIAYSIKNTALKMSLIVLALVFSFSFSLIRSSILDDYELAKIKQRDEMYYEAEVSANSNWRLWAIYEILENVIQSPSLIGNGYDSSTSFLEQKSGYLYRMKAHNVVSVFYDYGIVGFICSVILFIGLTKNLIRNMVNKNRDLLSHLAFIFSVLILSRFLFYYHTTIVWVYVVGIALIVAAERSQRAKNISI